MKSVIKAILFIGITAAFLQACIYLSTETHPQPADKEMTSSQTSMLNNEMMKYTSHSATDSLQFLHSKNTRWFFEKKKAARS